MGIYNNPSIYKNGLSKDDLDKLFAFEDITSEIEAVSGVTIKNGSKILYNKYLKQMNVNFSAYQSSTLNDSPLFKLPQRFTFISEATSPFCQCLKSDGFSNTNIGMYLLNISDKITFVGRSITGTNYGLTVRVILYMDEA
jgi:hypothetical protein